MTQKSLHLQVTDTKRVRQINLSGERILVLWCRGREGQFSSCHLYSLRWEGQIKQCFKDDYIEQVSSYGRKVVLKLCWFQAIQDFKDLYQYFELSLNTARKPVQVEQDWSDVVLKTLSS